MSTWSNIVSRVSAAKTALFSGSKQSFSTNGQPQYKSIKEAILAADKEGNDKKHRFLKYTEKAISRIRQDIKTWNEALASAQGEVPKNFALQLLYNEIGLDALLTSQIGNRTEQVFSCEFSLLDAKGEIDQEETDLLKQRPAYRRLTTAGLESRPNGYSLVELELFKKETGEFDVNIVDIPRTNVVPKTGLFYPDYSEDTSIPYREMAEYGTWILEFDSRNLGLLNKAVVHVLFKRFAQSCWSELCEIYGIPPRVMKTNTGDPDMMNRAESMMRDMGAAAWFIIDESEKFEWAQGVATNGDVYNNLIKLCSNEICLLFSGAVIGQDTVNGNRSKEESSQNMLWLLVQSDMAMMEEYWNNTIIPSFVKLGLMKPGLRFEYNPTEDLEQLWKITFDALQYYNIDPVWIKKKFGIEITGERQQIAGAAKQDAKETAKQMLSSFFD